MTKVTKVAQSSSSCSGSHKANKLRLWHLIPLETHTSVIPCSGVACKKVLHVAHTAKTPSAPFNPGTHFPTSS